MTYIIMDLEWNNSYMKSTQKFINEIIEIGAVKLDKELKEIDTFSELIKPVVSRKLRSRIKNLTHITNDDIKTGRPFTKVISDFEKWVGDDAVFLTWGDTDIRTLLSNMKVFLQKEDIPFLRKYADLQRYCQCFINMENIQQAGLSYAAQCLQIDAEQFPHHRALDDSLLSAECFKKTFDTNKLSEFIKECNEDFYARLAFHPYIIKHKDDPLIDKNIFNCYCDICGGKVKTIKKWKFTNQSFRGFFFCENCNREFRVNLRIKKFYDYIDIKRNYTEIIRTDEKTEQKSQENT
ncbi:MAG: exonuclease domain-containing protein [Clostridia bacterium]|nr:exonuclease domain-containing protein [Clostridia bacterium]